MQPRLQNPWVDDMENQSLYYLIVVSQAISRGVEPETLKTMIDTLKQLFAVEGKLVKEPCLFCQSKPVTEDQKQALSKKYETDFALHGFHCDDPNHAQQVHDLVSCPLWSCCYTIP